MKIPYLVKDLVKESGAVTQYYTVSNWYQKTYNSMLLRLSPVSFAKRRYKSAYGQNPDFKNPVLFAEKLQWLMLFWRHPLKTQCADKYTMRSYVQQLGWGHILPEILGVYENSNEINFSSLPDKFVLKCTHGCGFNILCENKAEFDINEAKNKLDLWMATDYSKIAGEIHYAEMKPRIICEQFLKDRDKEMPVDYKLYCFDGKVHCTLIVQGRSLEKHIPFYDFYCREWKTNLLYSKSSIKDNRVVPKPEAYDEMVAAAEALSKPFPFVRMDFYDINGKAVLGEMTFTPSGCLSRGHTEFAQKHLGDLFILPPRISSSICNKNK